MMNLLRAEWIKLRTVTMNWVLWIIAIVFPSLVVLINTFRSAGNGAFGARDLLDGASGSSFVPIMLGGIVAVVAITSEFGFGTIRPTFVAVPRRSRVLLAKGIIVVVLAALVVAVVIGITVGIGSIIAEQKGSTIRFADEPTALPTLVGMVVLGALFALAGYGIGMIARSTPGGISALILWPLLVENLVGGLLQTALDSTNVREWLPFQTGFRLAGLYVDSEGPSRLMSGLYFGAVAVAIACLGGWLVNRRDA